MKYVPVTNYVRGVNEDGEDTDDLRQAKVSIHHNAIVVDLAHPDGKADDDTCPRIWIEWRPGKGWVAVMHIDGNDPVGRVHLNDDGTHHFDESP